MVLFCLLIRRHTKRKHIIKEMMKMDFWSIDVPLGCRKDLDNAFRLIKLVFAILIINLIVVVTEQYILDIYAHWPFISRNMQPYYIAMCVLYTIGCYFVLYTHISIYSYSCFHTYCQILLLNEHYKQLRTNSGSNKQIEINVTNHLIIGIKQHNKLIR